MNYLDIHKEKLHLRYERVCNSKGTFLFQVRTFWAFLNNTQLFKSIIEEYLKKYESSAKFKADTFIKQSGTYMQEEGERFAVYAHLIQYIANTPNVGINNMDSLVRRHNVSPASNQEVANYFCEIFLNFFVDYLREKVNEKESLLHSMLRYKMNAEWFEASNLLELTIQNSKIGEALLKKNFFKFLLFEGMDFYIEPTSVSGDVDCIINNGKSRLIVESKIFANTASKDKKSILSGFHQIYTYANNYNENSGYLIIYKTGEVNIKFELKHTDEKIPYLYYNNKLFYFLVLDLNHDYTASKKGKLNTIEIKEDELIKSI